MLSMKDYSMLMVLLLLFSVTEQVDRPQPISMQADVFDKRPLSGGIEKVDLESPEAKRIQVLIIHCLY